MNSDELDFHLPPELIAQTPPEKRGESRLMHYRRADRSVAHRMFMELPSLLRAGDLLVFNNTRVLPARFALTKESGGFVEALFLDAREPARWHVLLKNVGASKPRLTIFGTEIRAEVIEQRSDGSYVITVDSEEDPRHLLDRIGRMPLPPYIKRDKRSDERDDLDRHRYQTVFAQQGASVAAPTAGLHFTDEVLNQLQRTGVDHAEITLDVGLGTFKPLTTDQLEDHVMHTEQYTIDEIAAAKLNSAKRDGRRIVAVGTTSARVLESQPADRPIEALQSSTSIFIYPPYRWKHVGALVTNFHLPRSTLIALVAAFVGIDEQRKLYSDAITRQYRFFSYGDAMLLE